MRPFFKEFHDLGASPTDGEGCRTCSISAFPEDEHTIVMKDGVRLRMFEALGPDLNSASPEQLDAHRAHANRAFLRLDEEFGWQVDYIRYPSAERAKRLFPDPVSSMIDHEAALHYAQEGKHHESRTLMAVAWRAPSTAQGRLGQAFVSGAPPWPNVSGSGNISTNEWPIWLAQWSRSGLSDRATSRRCCRTLRV